MYKCTLFPKLDTHLDFLHQVLVKVLVTFVNGICDGAVLGKEITFVKY